MNLKEKIRIYEDFLHKINLYYSIEPEKIGEALELINKWSYYHRIDTITEEEKEKRIETILSEMKEF